MNGLVPAILVNARCNNDGKLLTNGREMRNVSFYVTTYALKKQAQNYNLSAIFACAYAYHMECFPVADDLRHQQRLLLFRLCHAINHEQELSAPMVISYLMGWGDTYRSHKYSSIYWSSFVGKLLKHFSELRR